jgi:signal transduction histidine kinase
MKPVQEIHHHKRRLSDAKRLRALDLWIHDYRLACDILSAALLALLVYAMNVSTESVGFIFPQPHEEYFWGMLLCIPLISRHRWPDICAIAEISVVIIQIILGPPFITFDAIALLALYDALVLGNARFRALWTICAVIFPVASVLCAMHSWKYGPLLAPWSLTPDTRQEQQAMGFGDTSLRALLFLAEIASLAVMAFARFRRANREQSLLIAQSNQALSDSVREKTRAIRLAEHARIARDMHDMIAHTLSVIIVQADGGRFAGPTNPKLALSTMRTIETETQQSLASMQQLLSPHHRADRQDHDTSSSHPSATEQEMSRDLPSYVRIDRLVHEAQKVSNGQLSIHRTVIGRPPENLDDKQGTVLYRMIEEGLSNIRKHAIPTDHVVTVEIEETWPQSPTGTVHVSITDDGNGVTHPSHPGYGLIGMRERLASIGGTLTSGPLDHRTGRGFALNAEFPLTVPEKEIDRRTATQTGKYHRASRRQTLFEKISSWSMAHIHLCDVLFAVLLLTGELSICLPAIWSEKPPAALFLILSLITTALPLAWRRSSAHISAQASARLCSSCLALSLFFTSLIPLTYTTGIFVFFWNCANALLALNSVLLYSPRTNIPWVIPACASIIVLATASITVHSQLPSPKAVIIQMMISLISFSLFVVLIAFLARARREKGDNLVLLQYQHSALVAEKNEAAVTASRQEHEYVSSLIRTDIHSTLHSVEKSVQTALPRLETIARKKEGTITASDQHEIASLFAGIADTGRQALSQTRELLGLLRRTEDEKDADRVPLAPVNMAPIMTEVRTRTSKRHQ